MDIIGHLKRTFVAPQQKRTQNLAAYRQQVSAIASPDQMAAVDRMIARAGADELAVYMRLAFAVHTGSFDADMVRGLAEALWVDGRRRQFVMQARPVGRALLEWLVEADNDMRRQR